jgi:hypothetical protein
MSQLKVAVCFFGLFRSFDRTKETIKTNFLDIYNPDVFLYSPNTFYAKNNQDPLNGQDNPVPLTEDYVKNFFGDKLKDFVIWDLDPNIFIQQVQKNRMPEKNNIGQWAWRSYSMFHHIKKSLELRQNYERNNNIKYDVVILMRPDIELGKRMELEGLNLNKINHSVSHAASVFGFNILFGDHLLAAKPNVVDIFCSLYDRIGDYYRTGITLNNETLMGYHLIKNKIEWHKSDFVGHGVVR